MTQAPRSTPASLQAAEEIRLIAGAKHGDHASFETLVDRYVGRAVTVAMGYVGNREDALDMAQEAFYSVYKTLDRFREGEPFAPWFFRILRNCCLNYLARRRRRRARSIHGAGEDGRDMALPADGPPPSEAAEQAEIRTQIWRGLEHLSLNHREIILLRHFEDLDYAAIAEVLEVPIGTVMSRLYHARQNLRNHLDAYMEGGRT